jgi:menaquinone-dependent protoporphyrinogen oxidase
MTVLVAYGTTNGSTGEIARWVGDELRAAGVPTEVRPAATVEDVTGYQAVVLGGAVYAAGWHHDARRFAHRFAAQLATLPVWLFSSGPLDDSAEQGEVPPVPQVDAVLQAVGARGHATFGGRISDEAHNWLGLEGHRLAEAGHGGDFRNPARIRGWAREIAEAVRAGSDLVS